MKRLLLPLVALAAAVAVSLPATAGAATPCRNKIFNDWYQDGKIASTYPLGCYRDALKHVPLDADIYSSLKDDIRAALQAAVRRAHGLSAPLVVGKGFDSATGKGRKVVPVSKRSPHDPAPKPVAVAPVADSSGGGIPLPILILGGIAIALVAAGAIGLGVRHARNRGLPS